MGRKAQPRVSSSVTCVLPGLVWPAQMTSAAFNCELPGLAAILGRARPCLAAPEAYTSWLARQFGVATLAWGALRWASEDGVQQDQATPAPNILCADPVSLAFSSNTLILRGPQELALSRAEADALVASLNAEFGEIGQFYAPHPERWYLHTRHEIDANFQTLMDVLGRPVALFQPEGAKAAFWARLNNEIQILLHNHPVNRAREENDQALANALWFWGEPTGTPPNKLHPPAALLIGDEPILRGLATASNSQYLSIAAAGSPEIGHAAHTWWLDTRLQHATLSGDFLAWRDALQALDRDLLQPLWRTWQAGRLKQLRLIAPCDKTLLNVELGGAQRFAFWRGALTGNHLRNALETPSDQKS